MDTACCTSVIQISLVQKCLVSSIQDLQVFLCAFVCRSVQCGTLFQHVQNNLTCLLSVVDVDCHFHLICPANFRKCFDFLNRIHENINVQPPVFRGLVFIMYSFILRESPLIVSERNVHCPGLLLFIICFRLTISRDCEAVVILNCWCNCRVPLQGAGVTAGVVARCSWQCGRWDLMEITVVYAAKKASAWHCDPRICSTIWGLCLCWYNSCTRVCRVRDHLWGFCKVIPLLFRAGDMYMELFYFLCLKGVFSVFSSRNILTSCNFCNVVDFCKFQQKIQNTSKTHPKHIQNTSKTHPNHRIPNILKTDETH